MTFFRFDRITGLTSKTPYMTRIKFGSFRIHIIHRGDEDPNPHDHPFDLWSIPLFRGYVEQYWPMPKMSGELRDQPIVRKVPPWKVHKIDHWLAHRLIVPKPTVTLVWAKIPPNKKKGAWGFYVPNPNANGWRFYVPWRTYFGMDR